MDRTYIFSNYKGRSKNMLGSHRCHMLSFIVYIALQFRAVREDLGGSTLLHTLCTQFKSPYGYDESRVIHLPKLVQTGRQVDFYCSSKVLSSLIICISNMYRVTHFFLTPQSCLNFCHRSRTVRVYKQHLFSIEIMNAAFCTC